MSGVDIDFNILLAVFILGLRVCRVQTCKSGSKTVKRPFGHSKLFWRAVVYRERWDKEHSVTE
jgi:hypothetical protein